MLSISAYVHWRQGGSSWFAAPTCLHDLRRVRQAIIAVAPNNAFKPKPLRSTKHMAERACHVFGSATRFGLT